MLTGKNIILGVCGGIAAYKTPHLVRLFKKAGANVQVLATASALEFVSELSLATVSRRPVLRDLFELEGPGDDDKTMHITLGEWADAFVIAPATANTIARLCAGLCDDMLSVCFITLRPDKPVLIAPAMDGHMYGSPSVRRNLAALAAQGCRLLEPASGELASGQCGLGRMPEPEAIVEAVGEMLRPAPASPLNGLNVVVTAGPTREKIDGVRFLSNYSSGKMGFAVAREAARRGAVVRLVTGPVSLVTPAGVERIDVESAAEMLEAASRFFGTCDLFIGAAAVADYRPEAPVQGKIKKDDAEMELRLVRNPDILGEFSAGRRPGQISVGFALETGGGIGYAREKLERKRLDLVAFNVYDGVSTGFEVDTNALTLIDRDGNVTELPVMPKDALAGQLLDSIEQLLPSR
ncbi:MAG: bifunctional phosphopantothenoylcysteine decarboxylase/phosphopantothenate--cysteine ligase CoaBC [Chlorobiaceae bacterium]|nr:bifunctional phosphopantothenoylcysteine decarboxylase/phosphopantothenate--cysteine ligase CoaBC [Chlorobiaceae bacterium]